MKVLLLTRQFPPRESPVSTWSFEMAVRLAARCARFAVCAVGPAAWELGGSELPFELLRPPAGALRSASMGAWTLAAARARDCDVVLGTDWVSASLGLAWRGRSSASRVFAAVHGPELEWRRAPVPLGRVYRRTAELALGRFDAVFAAHAAAQASIAGVRVRRSEIIGRACDPARFRPAARGALARELGVLDRRVLLSAGRLVPERCIDRILYAVSALGVRYPELCCVIAGEGPEREPLERLAERLRIPHKVRFLGRVDPARLPELYNLCDVFVHLSGGAQPGAAELDARELLEARASAKPVLVTAQLAAAEGVDEHAGVIVPEDDSSSLGDAISALLDQPERARQLGQSARTQVLAHATWDVAADRLLCSMAGAARGTRVDRDGADMPHAERHGPALAEP